MKLLLLIALVGAGAVWAVGNWMNSTHTEQLTFARYTQLEVGLRGVETVGGRPYAVKDGARRPPLRVKLTCEVGGSKKLNRVTTNAPVIQSCRRRAASSKKAGKPRSSARS